MVAPFLRLPGGKGDTSLLDYAVFGVVVLGFAVLCWVFVLWIAPLIGKYTVTPKHEGFH